MRYPLKILVLASVLLLPLFTQPAYASGDLVWSVKIQDMTATLQVNQFDSQGKVFPVDEIRVNRIEDTSIVRESGGISPDLRLYVAPLAVNTNGTLGTTSLGAALSFYPETRVSKPINGSELTVLGLPGAEVPHGDVPVSYINLQADIPGQEIIGWAKLPNTEGIIHTSLSTFFFDATVTEPPGARTLPSNTLYLHKTVEAVVSADARKFAAVAKEDEKKRLYKLVVFDFEGRKLYEGEPQECSYDQLYLDGDYLTFRKESSRGPSETIVLNLNTGRMKVLSSTPDGIRYYSANGDRMVVVQLGEGRATLFDTSDPLNPKDPKEYEAGSIIITAALSGDGSLVALQIMNKEDNPNYIKQRVVILDADMREVARPLAETEIEGLHWVGKYLFVGFQKHPLPSGVHFQTTKQVNMYDFSK